TGGSPRRPPSRRRRARCGHRRPRRPARSAERRAWAHDGEPMPVTRICFALAWVAALAAAAPGARAAAGDDPILAALGRASLALQISPQQESAWRADYRHAVIVLSTLPKGVRRNEMRASLNIVRGIAARGALAPDVMPMAFLTLRRNAEWWATSGPPGGGGSPGEKDAQGRHCKPLPL